MKKTMSIALTAILIGSLAVPTFANNGNGNSKSGDNGGGNSNNNAPYGLMKRDELPFGLQHRFEFKEEFHNGLILEELVDRAEILLAEAEESDFYDEEAIDDLSEAIDEANTVLNDESASDEAYNEAIENLREAVRQVLASKVAEENALTAIGNYVDQIIDFLDEVQYGDDQGEYPADLEDVLLDAIEDAKTALEDEAITLGEINDIRSDLQEELRDFRASRYATRDELDAYNDTLDRMIDQADRWEEDDRVGTDIGQIDEDDFNDYYEKLQDTRVYDEDEAIVSIYVIRSTLEDLRNDRAELFEDLIEDNDTEL